MKKILFLIFFLCANYVFAQDTTVTTPIDTNEKVFTIVEVMPAFPGGNEELFKFLAKNIAYPVSKKENVMSGKVYVQFIVEKEGSLTNIKILKTMGCSVLGNSTMAGFSACPHSPFSSLLTRYKS